MRLPEHKHFFGVHGKKAESLSELRFMIKDMSEKDFNYHCSPEKNDFANWLRDILHRDYLADRILKVKTRLEILELIDDELIKDSEHNSKRYDEFKRFIVKEFIYGMIFGLVIGFIITQLLLVW